MKAIHTALTLTKAYKLAIERLEKMLGDEFISAIDLMNNASGHIIVCGMGKSGLVGRKISSTLASTGTPSIFLHPAEAIHGDLGKVQANALILLISYSGETGEILALIPALKRLNVTIIALTGEKKSTLANNASVILDMSVDREACPLNLAPTTSTMVTMVLGDALAVSLMELK
ncbi:SIS domain-containing protein, partial [Alphaproteobacteria bacterium]|nr:SIS domain-containing protein [Alphaproteobacteria bacterium]